jgi:hypothetical protein
MKPNEVSAYKRLKKNICGPYDRMERVENGLVDGMPDVNYCLHVGGLSPGREGWIEIKAPTEPKRATTALFASNHPVSVEQLNWLHAQHMSGGTGWLYIATEQRTLLIHGGRVSTAFRRINEMTVQELEAIANWKAPAPVGSAKLFWEELRSTLENPPR